MTIPIVWCVVCEHLRTVDTCDAFPDGIPDAILWEGFDHVEPFEGDNGIRFSPTTEPTETKSA